MPFFLAGTVALANAVAAAIRLPETKPSVDSVAPSPSRSLSLPKSPVQLRFALMAFIASLGFSGFEATFSLFGQRRFGLTESSTALVFLAVGVSLVAVQGAAIGPLTRRFGSWTLLLGGLLTTATGLVALSGANVIPVLLVAVVVIAFGQGVTSPSVTSIVTELVPPERRGEALGYQQSAGALGRVVGPVAAGAVFDGLNEGAPYVISATLFVVAFLLVRGLRPADR